MVFLSGCVGVPKVANVRRVLSMDFLATSTNELTIYIFRIVL